MRDEVHILVNCPIDTLQWGSTHSAMLPHENHFYIPDDFGLGNTKHYVATNYKKCLDHSRIW